MVKLKDMFRKTADLSPRGEKKKGENYGVSSLY